MIIIGVLGGVYVASKSTDNVETGQLDVLYGIPMKISLSGDFRFIETDENGNSLGSAWFWALSEQDKGDLSIQKLYEEFTANPRGVYEIMGKRDKDDCEYYEEGELVGTCIKTILIKYISLLQ